MAILEIAKIQVRRGDARTTGMPALDSGEFGWAIAGTAENSVDPELYIGNPDGDTPSNVRVLTQHDTNLFATISPYIYQGNNGVTIITGPNNNGDNDGRYIQNKLDETVSIADFGVVGDDSLTETAGGAPIYQQIQQAIDQIFYNSDRSKPISRKRLLFPAGTYNITGTIYIPPYATIVGEGPDKTLMKVTEATSYTVFQTVGAGDGTGYEYFDPDLTNMSDWVRNVRVEGISFAFSSSAGRSNVLPLLRLDCVENCVVTNCKFAGILSHSLQDLEYNDAYIGIELRGQGTINSTNVTIEQNTFDGVKTAVQSGYDIENINILNNRFTNLSRGVEWQAGGYATIGPWKTNIGYNVFENIMKEGIFVGDNTVNGYTGQDAEHVSTFNTFSQVGNNNLDSQDEGDESAVYSNINFESSGCVSIEDRFYRDDFIKSQITDSALSYIPTIQGNTFIQSNKVSVSEIINTTDSDPEIFLKVPFSGSDQTLNVQYIVNKTNIGITRKGNLLVSLAPNLVPSITDTYTYTGAGDGDIAFGVTLNEDTNTISMIYTSTNSIGTLEFRFTNLQ